MAGVIDYNEAYPVVDMPPSGYLANNQDPYGSLIQVNDYAFPVRSMSLPMLHSAYHRVDQLRHGPYTRKMLAFLISRMFDAMLIRADIVRDTGSIERHLYKVREWIQRANRLRESRNLDKAITWKIFEETKELFEDLHDLLWYIYPNINDYGTRWRHLIENKVFYDVSLGDPNHAPLSIAFKELKSAKWMREVGKGIYATNVSQIGVLPPDVVFGYSLDCYTVKQ